MRKGEAESVDIRLSRFFARPIIRLQENNSYVKCFEVFKHKNTRAQGIGFKQGQWLRGGERKCNTSVDDLPF